MKNRSLIVSFICGLILSNIVGLSPTRASMGGETGGGGNEAGLAAASSLRQAIADLKALSPEHFPTVNLGELEAMGQKAIIVIVDEPLVVNGPGYTQISTATNILGEQTPLIKVNSARWNKIGDAIEKKSLMAHELLSLLGLEATGNYRISAEYERILRSRPDGSNSYNEYACNVSASEQAMKYSTMILNIQLREVGLPKATQAEIFSKRMMSNGQAITIYPCFESMGELFEAIRKSVPYPRLVSAFNSRMDQSNWVWFIYRINFNSNVRTFYPASKDNPIADSSRVSDIFSK